uniref:Elongation factor Ts, mitochondrial n=1 Tax=Ganoderma boninense TaxID=34458 RepID=A0A5K1JUK3_9APHY|nr:N/A [Ganoderma boninense]
MYALRRAATSAPRFYSTSAPVKPSVKLIAELRKMTEGVSLTKAREALAASNNDLQAALTWLDTDRAATGAAKVAKLADRVAGQGLIGVHVLSPGLRTGASGSAVRAAMVELNCETDFVARNELFNKLLGDIAHTAAFLAEPHVAAEGAEGEGLIRDVDLDALCDAPLLDHIDPLGAGTSPAGRLSAHTHTIGSAVRDLVTKVGEKITLRRAVGVARNPLPRHERDLGLRVFPYLHGAVTVPTNGTKGALGLLAFQANGLQDLVADEKFQTELGALQRSLGRTIVGFPVRRVGRPGEEDAEALYSQPSDMFMNASGKTVLEELKNWAERNGMGRGGSDDGAVAMVEFKKWSVGEPLESTESS